jgi:hypothetical protein
VHEFAYYWVIGLDFRGLLSAADYIKAAIFWLPLTVATHAVPFGFVRFLKRRGLRETGEADAAIVLFLTVAALLILAMVLSAPLHN